ncbi:MAG: hypothetical protein AAF682_20305 [Planctomycetota bacterium]
MSFKFRILAAGITSPRFGTPPVAADINRSIPDAGEHLADVKDCNTLQSGLVMSEFADWCRGKIFISTHAVDDPGDTARRARARELANAMTTVIRDGRAFMNQVSLLPYSSRPAGNAWDNSGSYLFLHPIWIGADRRLVYGATAGEQLSAIVVESDVISIP